MNIRRLTPLLVVGALALAVCGSNSDASDSPATSPPPTSAGAAVTTAARRLGTEQPQRPGGRQQGDRVHLRRSEGRLRLQPGGLRGQPGRGRGAPGRQGGHRRERARGRQRHPGDGEDDRRWGDVHARRELARRAIGVSRRGSPRDGKPRVAIGCGAGCKSVGTSAWTRDCGNHDRCEQLHSTSNCNDDSPPRVTTSRSPGTAVTKLALALIALVAATGNRRRSSCRSRPDVRRIRAAARSSRSWRRFRSTLDRRGEVRTRVARAIVVAKDRIQLDRRPARPARRSR